MRKVKTDNSDLIEYVNTVKELKNHIPIEEYRNEYRKLRSDDIPLVKAQKFKSAHTELRRLEKKRESLIEYFIDELNPISSSKANTSARSTGNLDLFNERVLYRKAISEKSDEESAVRKEQEERQAKLEAFRQKLLEDGIDPAELLAAVSSSQPKAKSTRTPRPAKYKYTDENGNEQTWTGQGRTPKAIAAAIEAGKTLEDFAI